MLLSLRPWGYIIKSNEFYNSTVKSNNNYDLWDSYRDRVCFPGLIKLLYTLFFRRIYRHFVVTTEVAYVTIRK